MGVVSMMWSGTSRKLWVAEFTLYYFSSLVVYVLIGQSLINQYEVLLVFSVLTNGTFIKEERRVGRLESQACSLSSPLTYMHLYLRFPWLRNRPCKIELWWYKVFSSFFY